MTRLWTLIDVRLRVLLVILVIVFLPVAWYLGSPLFINKTVDESFPSAASSTQNQPAMMANDSKPVAAGSAESSLGESDSGAMPNAVATSSSSAGMSATDSMAADTAGAGMSATSPAAVASEPVALSSGQFGEIDVIHKGQGKATLFKLADGKRVLRLEDFSVTNGPDLYVYLSGHPAPRTGEQVHQDGFEVAQLKGNIGNHNYELPDELDLSKFKSVVIYCRRFSVVFSTAELAAEAP